MPVHFYITRRQYDTLLDRDVELLQELYFDYRLSWGFEGLVIYHMSIEHRGRIFAALYLKESAV